MNLEGCCLCPGALECEKNDEVLEGGRSREGFLATGCCLGLSGLLCFGGEAVICSIGAIVVVVSKVSSSLGDRSSSSLTESRPGELLYASKNPFSIAMLSRRLKIGEG